MPIKVPNNLPAIDTLIKENVFVMTDTRAMTQDVRPLRILLLNLMPTKIETETQFTRLLGNTPIQIELELLQTATYKAHVTSQEHMIAFYKTFNDVKSEYYDGMIITGAPVELMKFEDVDYWEELCEIMEWSKSHVHSTFHICWGAQAGLYYHYGIQKRLLPEKLSGVYKHTLDYKDGMLFRGFDDEFYVPHSRNTTCSREDIEAVPELKIVASSEEAGVFCVKSLNDRQFFVMGHSEYDWDTLLKEYMRDKNAGLNPHVPENYFPNDDDSQKPIVRWRSCANLIYSNWINYFVYQSTPYDIHLIHNEDLAPALTNKSNLTVAKFGGTSLADSGQFKKVSDIIAEDSARKYIVVSAPGRRRSDDPKVTDLLISAAKSYSEDSDEYHKKMEEAHNRFIELKEELGVPTDVNEIFGEIYTTADNIAAEDGDLISYIASRGEYICGRIMADYLDFDFIDASNLIVFGDDGVLDKDATRELTSRVLREHQNAVVPGFYGADSAGRIKTLERGGSDITGALIAAAVKADLYENWTDVPGLLMADPKIVKNPLSVPVIIYKELRELALSGAEVLHEDTIAPVRNCGIPINIRSTNEPDKPGTMIVKSADSYENILDISSITGKTGYASVLIEKENLSFDTETRLKIDSVFQEFGLTVTGEQRGSDSLAVIVKAEEIRDREEELSNALIESAYAEDVTISTGLSSISVVGRNIPSTAFVAVRIFDALAKEGINIRFIDHAPQKISVQIGVAESEYKKAIRAIYRAFTDLSDVKY